MNYFDEYIKFVGLMILPSKSSDSITLFSDTDNIGMKNYGAQCRERKQFNSKVLFQ